MSDFGEALGTATEGGLFARVVGGKLGKKRAPAPSEPDAPEEGTCLNCGSQLVGAHCHACGQKVHIHRTITAIFHDLIHGVLHLDGKLWSTLPLLTFKPGQITRRYINGERAKFVSPMAMFLFSVFLMFAIFQALGFTTPTTIATNEQVEAGLVEVREKAEGERDALAERIAAMAPDDPQREQRVSELQALEEGLAGLGTVSKLAEETKLGGNFNFTATGVEWLDNGIIKKWRENPGLMLYKLQNNSYKFSWLLIPLSIPFVWLLFAWRRRFKAYDHAIFVTYSLAFMSLLFITLSVLGKLGVTLWIVLAAGGLIPPVHIYKHLRGTYALGRLSAFWRLLAISLFIWIVVILFLQLLLVLGAF